MKKILVTAFEPFNHETINPSTEIIQRLDEHQELMLIRKVLPVEFKRSKDIIIDLIDQYEPDIVLMLGQAGGRKHISLERIAINLDNASIPDNIGEKPENLSIDPSGPVAYFQSLPIDQLKNELMKNDYPVEISYSAGTYVCNHVMYVTLNHIAKNGLNTIAGFVHVPYMNEQVIEKKNTFSISLDTMVQAINLIIKTLVEV